MQSPKVASKPNSYPVRSALTFAICVVGALVLGGAVLFFATPQQALSLFRLSAPLQVLVTILFALAVPPLPWMLAWLLGQAWRYMFPIDEQRSAMRLAWRVSAGVSALIAFALAFWLLDISAAPAITGVVTIITIVICVFVGVRTARERQFTDAFVRNMGIGTALLACIVPLNVFATFGLTMGNGSLLSLVGSLTWPFTLLLIFGFIAYRRALARYLDQLHSRVTLWQLDRLALEILGLFLLMFVPLSVVTAIILNTIGGMAIQLSCVNGLLAIFGVPFLGALVLAVFTRWRGRGMVIKKKASPLELHDTPLFADNRWFRMLFTRTVIWLGATFVVWVLLFMAESYIFFASGTNRLLGP